MNKNIKVKVYAWNPNGTNDIEIVDIKTSEVLETIQQCLFGVNLGARECTFMTLINALGHIAVSPVDDGTRNAELIKSFI